MVFTCLQVVTVVSMPNNSPGSTFDFYFEPWNLQNMSTGSFARVELAASKLSKVLLYQLLP